MGNVVQASNMLSGEKCALMIDPRLIDEKDIPALEHMLREHVQLAPANVSIYIQISEKLLKKQAKAA
jgi:DNA-binding protein YbaB